MLEPTSIRNCVRGRSSFPCAERRKHLVGLVLPEGSHTPQQACQAHSGVRPSPGLWRIVCTQIRLMVGGKTEGRGGHEIKRDANQIAHDVHAGLRGVDADVEGFVHL